VETEDIDIISHFAKDLKDEEEEEMKCETIYECENEEDSTMN